MPRPPLSSFQLLILLACFLQAHNLRAEGLDWPANHLLPTFSEPASTIDCIEIARTNGPEQDLFASLEGIINRTQPRIACVSGKSDDNKLAWFKIHRLKTRTRDGYRVLRKYQDSVSGLVVTDPSLPPTVDLATTIAGLDDELICDPSLLARLTNAPFHLAVKEDLRGRFANRREVYDYLYTNCWPRCTHRVIAGLSPELHGYLRDYMVAVRGASVWLAPGKGGEPTNQLGRFIADLRPAHGVYLGWWPSEDDGLGWIGQYGVQVLASDFFNNASLFGGVRTTLHIPATPPPPPLSNKIYVAIFLSDGDNVQYMQHGMKTKWADPARGAVPIGWTVSPLSVDLDPGMLDYYYRTSTTNDCLVSGPSGAGYARLNHWKRPADLDEFAKVTEPYLRRSGIRVITVWSKITDAIAEDFAADCPSLLGITDQSGDGYTKLVNGLPTIGFAWHADYAGSVKDLRAGIDKASENWSGAAPCFVAVQGNVWHISPADCKKLAGSLDMEKYVVVRPDQFFMLFKQWEERAKH